VVASTQAEADQPEVGNYALERNLDCARPRGLTSLTLPRDARRRQR